MALRFELGDENDVPICRLCLEYDAADPLSVRVAVRAPSDAIVVERTMLRADLRSAFLVPVTYGSMRVEPAGTPGVMVFRLWEQGVALTMLIPASPIVRFLAESDQLVDPIVTEARILEDQLVGILSAGERAKSEQ